jgi:tetratricopeptide (TPR) repeat protein
MKRLLIVLALVSLPCGALAQSDQDWSLCKAVDADDIAIAACTRLIEANTLVSHDLAVAYYNRGAAHWRERDSGAAIADEDRAIEIDPNLADAYMRRGAAYWNKRDEDRSIADSSKAIEIDPKNVRAYSNRALFRALKKKDKEYCPREEARQ